MMSHYKTRECFMVDSSYTSIFNSTQVGGFLSSIYITGGNFKVNTYSVEIANVDSLACAVSSHKL